MTEIVDLWPDEIKVEKLMPPVTILRQQASLLGKKTKNIVQGEVEDVRSGLNENLFIYTFYIVVPALNNYRYRLFNISYELSLYPLQMYVENDIRKEIPPDFIKTKKDDAVGPLEFVYADSEEDFLKILKAIFNSTKVVRIISVLLSQSDPSYDQSLKENEMQQ
jgi:hypothetical protein